MTIDKAYRGQTNIKPYIQLGWLVVIVFMGFLTLGLPITVLPLYVHGDLLFSAFIVGLVMGMMSLVTLVTRMYAGYLADTHGAKRIVMAGLVSCSLSGVSYYFSSLIAAKALALGVLILGRVFLGLGESMVMTGGLAWGIGLLGKERAELVISWLGLAMYSAFAFGAPLGTLVFEKFGFSRFNLFIVIFPIVALLIAYHLSVGKVVSIRSSEKRMSVGEIFASIYQPGMGMALGAVGFALISAFISLYYQEKGWSGASLSLTIFGVFYILIRLFFIHTIKKFGANRVAMVMLLIGATGQALLWCAPTEVVAILGVALTGVGYSLILPCFSVEVIRKVNDSSRATALGGYTAFFDLALAVSSPIAGFFLSRYKLDYASIFIAGVITSMLAFLIAYRLQTKASS